MKISHQNSRHSKIGVKSLISQTLTSFFKGGGLFEGYVYKEFGES